MFDELVCRTGFEFSTLDIEVVEAQSKAMHREVKDRNI